MLVQHDRRGQVAHGGKGRRAGSQDDPAGRGLRPLPWEHRHGHARSPQANGQPAHGVERRCHDEGVATPGPGQDEW